MSEELRDRLKKNYLSKAKIERFVPSPDGDVGLVVKVYDGDSWTIMCEIGGRASIIAIRLRGIDTPEIRGSSLEERGAALAVRDVCRFCFLGKLVSLSSYGNDKYGRLLCDVSSDGNENVGAFLLRNGFANSYSGGSKAKFAEDFLKLIVKNAETYSES